MRVEDVLKNHRINDQPKVSFDTHYEKQDVVFVDLPIQNKPPTNGVLSGGFYYLCADNTIYKYDVKNMMLISQRMLNEKITYFFIKNQVIHICSTSINSANLHKLDLNLNITITTPINTHTYAKHSDSFLFLSNGSTLWKLSLEGVYISSGSNFGAITNLLYVDNQFIIIERSNNATVIDCSLFTSIYSFIVPASGSSNIIKTDNGFVQMVGTVLTERSFDTDVIIRNLQVASSYSYARSVYKNKNFIMVIGDNSEVTTLKFDTFTKVRSFKININTNYMANEIYKSGDSFCILSKHPNFDTGRFQKFTTSMLKY